MNSRKRLIHTLFMPLILAGGLAGCAETVTEEAAEAPVAEPTPEPMESAVVLNPNQAGEEELLALPQLDETLVAMILEERPFLSMTELAARLNESLSQEQQGGALRESVCPHESQYHSRKGLSAGSGRGSPDRSRVRGIPSLSRPSINSAGRSANTWMSRRSPAWSNMFSCPSTSIPPAMKRSSPSRAWASVCSMSSRSTGPYQSMEQFRREIGKYVDEQEVSPAWSNTSCSNRVLSGELVSEEPSHHIEYSGVVFATDILGLSQLVMRSLDSARLNNPAPCSKLLLLAPVAYCSFTHRVFCSWVQN